MLQVTTILQFIVTCWCITLAHASAGDRDFNFTNCVAACQTSKCYPGSTNPESILLRLMRWTCLDDCRYHCMQSITNHRVQRDQPMLQYFGKWPFYRFGGMQEPASVAFSLLNLIFHLFGARRIWSQVPAGHPMKAYYLALSMVHLNTWIWSSVFHARDTPLTEKLDYFSAGLSILSAFYVAVVRIFHLYTSQRLTLTTKKGPPNPFAVRNAWTVLCIVSYLAHITYLGLRPRFDYSYNVIANLVVGMAHNLLWLAFSLPNSWIRRYPGRDYSYRPPFANKAAIFVIMTTAATCLELFDFQPWRRVIDAHSLWHLATGPIAKYWYGFIVQDCLDDSWRLELKGSYRA